MKWCLHRNTCTAKYFFVENWAFSCYMSLLEGPKRKKIPQQQSNDRGAISQLYNNFLPLHKGVLHSIPWHERSSGCGAETRMSPTVWTNIWSRNIITVFPCKRDFNMPDLKLMCSGSIALQGHTCSADITSELCEGRHALLIVIFSCNFRIFWFTQIQEKLSPVFWLVSWMAGGSKEHSSCSPVRRYFGFASYLSFSSAVTIFGIMELRQVNCVISN